MKAYSWYQYLLLLPIANAKKLVNFQSLNTTRKQFKAKRIGVFDEISFKITPCRFDQLFLGTFEGLFKVFNVPTFVVSANREHSIACTFAERNPTITQFNAKMIGIFNDFL